MITIIDYGMGNLRSVAMAFESLGVGANVCQDPARLKQATAVVVPGVGSFQKAMANLKSNGLDEALHNCWEKGVPLLGICLGMQLFSAHGEEGGIEAGLGYVAGSTRRLVGAPKLPHVGWNTLTVKKTFLGLTSHGKEPYMYFTHSFVLTEISTEIVSASACYGVEFPVAIEQDNLFGVQFHPEKSGAQGIRLLHEFARRAGERSC